MAASDKKKKDPAKSEFLDEREEISFLRQRFNSLSIRGHYKECFKLIEEKLGLLYFKERWPENFLSSLTIHKRCYPSMDIDKPYDEYLEGLLRKNKIPVVFVELLHGGGKHTDWKQEFFKDRAFAAESEGRMEYALGYADLMSKVDPLNSNAHFLRGWMLRGMDRSQEAIEAFERALELNKTNYQANRGLAEAYADIDPARGLEYIDAAIEQSPGDPDLQTAKARIYLKMGETEKAMAAYDEAIALDPLNPSYPFQKAEQYEKEGQTIAAVRQYAAVLNVDEGHIPSLTRLALLTADSAPEQALRYILPVVAHAPEDRNLNLVKARLQDKTGDVQGAIRQYKKVAELDEDCSEAWGALGRLTLADSPQRALPFFERAAALSPGNAKYHMGKAKCYREMGDEDAALSAYREAINLDKSNAEAYAELGYLVQEADPKAAMGHFNRAISLDLENSGYHRAKGELLIQMGASVQEILTCFNNATKYDPGNAELHLILAGLLEQTGNLASAIEHYGTAASLTPHLEEAHYGLARLLKDSDPATALTHIDKALALASARGDYLCLKSRIYTQLGKHPEAVRELKAGLSLEESNLDAHQELAQLLDGDTPRVAMMYINRALELSPENPEYLCVRAELLLALGDEETAREQYRRALARDENYHPALFGMGMLLARDDKNPDGKKALELLTKAEALAPQMARYTAEKALCLARDPHRYLEALDCLDEAIAKDNQMWDIILTKARLLEEHDEPLPAMDHYRRVLLIDPDCLEATARMGFLLADYNPRGALAYLERAIRLDPGNYRYYVWQSRLLHQLGDAPGGEAAAQKALELGGQGEETYATLARLLSTKHPHAALEYCQKAAELSPQRPDYPLLRGNILRGINRPQEAVESFLAALALDGGCHEALARIAELYYRQGKPESLEYIDKAIEINAGNASYHYIRGLIQLELLEDLPEAVSCVQMAVTLAPGNLAYREKLVELLGKSRAIIQRFVQKRKLDKLRRRLQKMEEAAQREQ